MKSKENQNRQRDYQKPSIEEDLYQFEMGNELGAKLYKEKEAHKKKYCQKQKDKNFSPYQ